MKRLLSLIIVVGGVANAVDFKSYCPEISKKNILIASGTAAVVGSSYVAYRLVKGGKAEQPKVEQRDANPANQVVTEKPQTAGPVVAEQPKGVEQNNAKPAGPVVTVKPVSKQIDPTYSYARSCGLNDKDVDVKTVAENMHLFGWTGFNPNHIVVPSELSEADIKFLENRKAEVVAEYAKLSYRTTIHLKNNLGKYAIVTGAAAVVGGSYVAYKKSETVKGYADRFGNWTYNQGAWLKNKVTGADKVAAEKAAKELDAKACEWIAKSEAADYPELTGWQALKLKAEARRKAMQDAYNDKFAPKSEVKTEAPVKAEVKTEADSMLKILQGL